MLYYYSNPNILHHDLDSQAVAGYSLLYLTGA